MSMQDNKKLVQVENYPTLITAELAKSKLDLAGIGSEIFDGETANMNWLYTAAIGGVKLMVREEDLEAAREVLAAEVDSEEPEIPPDKVITGAEQFCPACHSRDVETQERRERGFSIGDVLNRLLGDAKPRRCRKCGNEWKG
jgi:hypothetical protein